MNSGTVVMNYLIIVCVFLTFWVWLIPSLWGVWEHHTSLDLFSPILDGDLDEVWMCTYAASCWGNHICHTEHWRLGSG